MPVVDTTTSTTTPMVIVAGHVPVPAEERDAYVERMQDLVRRARDFHECVRLAATADPLDRSRVDNTEVRRDREASKARRLRADAPHQPELEAAEVGFQEPRSTDPM